MIGKLLAAFVLVGLIVACVILIATGVVPSSVHGTPNATAITVSALGGGAFVFLLNLFGLAFRPKYFGGLGVLISGLLLSYGIYALVTKDTLISVKKDLVSVVGGFSAGTGAVSLLTSIGILTR